MTATHNDLITLNYVLDPAPIASTNFGLVLILCEDIGFTGGDLYRSYSSNTTAAADNELTAAAKEAARVAFSQIRKPSAVLIGEVQAGGLDLGSFDLTFDDGDDSITRATGSWIADGVLPGDTITPAGTSDNNTTYTVESVESATEIIVEESVTAEASVTASSVTWVQTYDNALTNITAAGAEYFGVTTESRVNADILLISAAIEAAEKAYAAQTDEADALTAGWPSALSAIEDRENTALIYHDDDNEWADVAWLVSRLAYDFDSQSPTATGAIREVAAASVTETQRNQLRSNNINVPLAFGSEGAYVDPGVNAAGRPWDHIWSVYWFVDRANARLQALKLEYDARGEKIPMTAVGQEILRSRIQEQIDIAVGTGHFREDQFVFEFPDPISAADVSARDLKATVYITLESGARTFTITFNFSRDNVVPANPEEV